CNLWRLQRVGTFLPSNPSKSWGHGSDSQCASYCGSQVLKGLGYRQNSEKLHHYRYRILPKPSGEIRLIEAPKSRLRELQRKVLSRILSRIPPHPAAHGFIKGRSIKTFVLLHVGQHVRWRVAL